LACGNNDPIKDEAVLKRLFIFVTIVGCVLPAIVSAKSWLCIADQSAGFHEVGKTWVSATFTTSTKIIIKPFDFTAKDAQGLYDVLASDLTDFEKRWYRSSFSEFGAPIVSGLCDVGLWEDAIHCRDGGAVLNETMVVDLKAMRFQRYFPFGYVLKPDNKYKLTPFIEIGTCSEL
jgi:hypothetical protein